VNSNVSKTIESEIVGSVRSLRKATRDFAVHYHSEPNHQGLGNRSIEPDVRSEPTVGRIQYLQRLGGCCVSTTEPLHSSFT